MLTLLFSLFLFLFYILVSVSFIIVLLSVNIVFITSDWTILTAFNNCLICVTKVKFFFYFQIAYLNLTLDELKKKVKLPESASTLTKDIDSLKKGMADTGGDITEIKDKIKLLRDLADKQEHRMEKLIKNVYNLSVSIIHVIIIKQNDSLFFVCNWQTVDILNMIAF